MAPKILALILLGSFSLRAQEANPTQRPPQPQQGEIRPDPNSSQPIFRIEVVEHTIAAVNYLHRGGSTRIDFNGTPIMGMGKGSAKVESERGVIKIGAEFKNMAPPSSFGPEYLTYVLWAISPDGRPVNLGELTLNGYGMGSDSKIDTTSDIQTFGMIVTAEPYYSVTQPSDVVVMENIVRPTTQGVIENINAKFELLPRGMYTNHGKASGFAPVLVGKKDPFELYEAQNAVQLARVAGAQKYAADSFQKAQDALQQSLKYQVQKPGQKPVITMAREACLRAEDARIIALRAERAEALQMERDAGVARENAEKQKAEEARMRAEDEARARRQAEMDRLQAEQAKTEAMTMAQNAQHDAENARMEKAAAERAKAEALQAKADADQARMAAEKASGDAEQARAAAVAQQQLLAGEADRAKMAAADADRMRADADRMRADADRMRMKAEQDQAALRQQLLDQFNSILQTRDTARGLIVNMSDVLFDTARYTLKPGAREKLAKVSGIILGHPGLKIQVEGHTDSVGGDEYNMKLSENRAGAVRDFLVAQGVPSSVVTSQGFGKTMPVADNSSAAGRQQNRRVELVVSGEILGTTLTTVRTTTGGSSNPR
ncbi:MAG TPA: OmpA family protein [Bryobacteraceae bacterium]|nr:OmpA family protein [Bryobacteraceae bacterium]